MNVMSNKLAVVGVKTLVACMSHPMLVQEVDLSSKHGQIHRAI